MAINKASIVEGVAWREYTWTTADGSEQSCRINSPKVVITPQGSSIQRVFDHSGGYCDVPVTGCSVRQADAHGYEHRPSRKHLSLVAEAYYEDVLASFDARGMRGN